MDSNANTKERKLRISKFKSYILNIRYIKKLPKVQASSFLNKLGGFPTVLTYDEANIMGQIEIRYPPYENHTLETGIYQSTKKKTKMEFI